MQIIEAIIVIDEGFCDAIQYPKGLPSKAKIKADADARLHNFRNPPKPNPEMIEPEVIEEAIE